MHHDIIPGGLLVRHIRTTASNRRRGSMPMIFCVQTPAVFLTGHFPVSLGSHKPCSSVRSSMFRERFLSRADVDHCCFLPGILLLYLLSCGPV